jgi:hypothetical protein
VAEQALDGGDGHPDLDQVTAESVAELMARNPYTRPATVMSQPKLDGSNSHATTQAADEDGLILHSRADRQPFLQGDESLVGEVGNALGAILAAEPQAWQAARGRLEIEITQREVSNLANPETTSQHQQEHSAVTGGVDDDEQLLNLGIFGVARQSSALADEMTLGDYGVGWSIAGCDPEKLVKRPDSSESTVDGSRSVAAFLAVPNVDTYVANGDSGGGLVSPLEEEVEVVFVVNVRARVWAPAQEPLAEPYNFG